MDDAPGQRERFDEYRDTTGHRADDEGGRLADRAGVVRRPGGDDASGFRVLVAEVVHGVHAGLESGHCQQQNQEATDRAARAGSQDQ
jgi:hypothetical protein